MRKQDVILLLITILTIMTAIVCIYLSAKKSSEATAKDYKVDGPVYIQVNLCLLEVDIASEMHNVTLQMRLQNHTFLATCSTFNALKFTDEVVNLNRGHFTNESDLIKEDHLGNKTENGLDAEYGTNIKSLNQSRGNDPYGIVKQPELTTANSPRDGMQFSKNVMLQFQIGKLQKEKNLSPLNQNMQGTDLRDIKENYFSTLPVQNLNVFRASTLCYAEQYVAKNFWYFDRMTLSCLTCSSSSCGDSQRFIKSTECTIMCQRNTPSDFHRDDTDFAKPIEKKVETVMTRLQKRTSKQNVKDTCFRKKKPGKCKISQKPILRWYFDTREGKCKKFSYSGCNGNQINFKTKALCMERCNTYINLNKDQ